MKKLLILLFLASSFHTFANPPDSLYLDAIRPFVSEFYRVTSSVELQREASGNFFISRGAIVGYSLSQITFTFSQIAQDFTNVELVFHWQPTGKRNQHFAIYRFNDKWLLHITTLKIEENNFEIRFTYENQKT